MIVGYQRFAVILTSSLLLAAGIEAIARAGVNAARTPAGRAIRAGFLGRPTRLYTYYASLPYYTSQSWTSRYWEEHAAADRKRYSPYVLWRTRRFDGELLKVDDDGIRFTPDARCAPGARKVFVFGGSVMWGYGSPDRATIPAYLQKYLQPASDQPVCVVNYAEQAYVSTQNIIQLTRLLEAGNVPAMVIFYDGVNDVLAARWSGRPMIHQAYNEVAEGLERTGHPFEMWVSNLQVVALSRLALSGLLGTRDVNPATLVPNFGTDQLAQSVVDAYLNDRRIVKALAEAYGFEYHFFWQPNILLGQKRLTREEQEMVNGGLDWAMRFDRPLVDLFKGTYRRIQKAAARDEHLHYLGNIFDAHEEQVWMDTWAHILPPANAVVAKEIARVVEPSGFAASPH